MLKKLVPGLIFGVLSFSSYADFSGVYQCEGMHKGHPIKWVTNITQKDMKLSMSMKWDDKNKVTTGDLMSTNELNKFINSWKCEHSVGISLWEFKDNSININTTSLRIDNTSKIEEVFNCIKK